MHGGESRDRCAPAVALVALLGTLAGDARDARADGAPPLPLAVEYSAPGNCPTQADFEARVKARTALARFADDKDAQAVRVVVKPMGVTYSGHLSIVGRTGRQSERDVEDTLCSDVVDALALVTALAVDPNASLSPSAPPTAPTPAGPTTPEGPAPESAEGIPLVAPAPTKPPSPKPSPSAPPRASAPAEGRTPLFPPPRWDINLGASFTTSTGLAPDTLAGGGAFGELEASSRSWLAPTARLTLEGATNGAFTSRTVAFLFFGGRADVCPVRLGWPDLSLRPCLGLDAGAIRAERLTLGVPGYTAWSAFAAFLRGRWAPGGGRWFLETDAGGFLATYRPTFIFNNGRFIYQSKAGGPTVAVTVGLSFR